MLRMEKGGMPLAVRSAQQQTENPQQAQKAEKGTQRTNGKSEGRAASRWSIASMEASFHHPSEKSYLSIY
jgi:hypothetical protein